MLKSGIEKSMKDLLDVLQEDGKVIIYDNSIAKKFSLFLGDIYYNFTSEDAGGNHLAPEMWRFFKI